MIEVEFKAKIENYTDFKKKVKDIGRFIRTEKKTDDYYSLEYKEYRKKSLRIRKREGFYEVNFKKRISFIDGVHAKKEVEFRIDKIEDFLNLMEEFGFKKWLKKEKISEVYEIGENFHIEINDVKGLGKYVEVEFLSNEKGINNARKKVLEIVNKLGLDKKQGIKEGYTKMLWNKKFGII